MKQHRKQDELKFRHVLYRTMQTCGIVAAVLCIAKDNVVFGVINHRNSVFVATITAVKP